MTDRPPVPLRCTVAAYLASMPPLTLVSTAVCVWLARGLLDTLFVGVFFGLLICAVVQAIAFELHRRETDR